MLILLAAILVTLGLTPSRSDHRNTTG
jgi:hypothetical protein